MLTKTSRQPAMCLRSIEKSLLEKKKEISKTVVFFLEGPRSKKLETFQHTRGGKNFFFKLTLFIYLLIFIEGNVYWLLEKEQGKERKREREREMSMWERNTDGLPLTHTPSRGGTCTLGTCPDREWNHTFWCMGQRWPNWATWAGQISWMSSTECRPHYKIWDSEQ